MSALRLVDTRPGRAQALRVAQQRLHARQLLAVDVAAQPAVGPDATAVTVNITAATPIGAGRGFLVVYACGLTERPLVSNLNVVAATTVANRALVATAGGQTLCVYSSVDTDIVIDVEALIT